MARRVQPGPSRVSDSPVSAGNIIYEAFDLNGELRRSFSSTLQQRKRKGKTSPFVILLAFQYFTFLQGGSKEKYQPISLQKKSRIRETSNLSTDADRRTDTILERLRDLSFKKIKSSKIFDTIFLLNL